MSDEWVKEAPLAVTVCDEKGIIVEMNDLSARSFADSGGRGLIGSNVLDCHPEPSRSKLRSLIAERGTNVYTIQKHGKKKLIFQAPWYQDGRYAGVVELSLEIPPGLPHFDRDKDGST